MNQDEIDHLYQAFGNLVQTRRKQMPDMTQDKLGQLVGLSRTSITNVEKGRQHIALHQVFAIAAALEMRPEGLLPASNSSVSDSWVDSKLPPHTELKVKQWVTRLARPTAGGK